VLTMIRHIELMFDYAVASRVLPTRCGCAGYAGRLTDPAQVVLLSTRRCSWKVSGAFPATGKEACQRWFAERSKLPTRGDGGSCEPASLLPRSAELER